MPRTAFALVAGIVLILQVGCSDSSTAPEREPPPDDYELPEPDPSLDPSRIVVGDFIATPCMFRRGAIGRDAFDGQDRWETVDIFFGRATAAGPWTGPIRQDSLLVERHAGRILYSFHVPAVRARIIYSRIPDLVVEGYWITVREVPDATRYDLPVSVGFNRPLADDDVELFGALGGRVDYRHDFINAVAGPFPDRSIGVLRAKPHVAWVHASGVACIN